MVGSSANATDSGQKFRMEDIEDGDKEVADLIVDYGLQRYHIYERSFIGMDFGQIKSCEWDWHVSCLGSERESSGVWSYQRS